MPLWVNARNSHTSKDNYTANYERDKDENTINGTANKKRYNDKIV